MNGTTVKRICSNFPTVVLLVMSITTSKLLVHINVKKNYRFKHTCNDDNDIGCRKQQKLDYHIFHM